MLIRFPDLGKWRGRNRFPVADLLSPQVRGCQKQEDSTNRGKDGEMTVTDRHGARESDGWMDGKGERAIACVRFFSPRHCLVLKLQI